eukprot:6211796-Pleurochrysis_carterae.AAC.2
MAQCVGAAIGNYPTYQESISTKNCFTGAGTCCWCTAITTAKQQQPHMSFGISKVNGADCVPQRQGESSNPKNAPQAEAAGDDATKHGGFEVELANFERERAVKQKPPAAMRRRQTAARNTLERGVLADCCTKYPGEWRFAKCTYQAVATPDPRGLQWPTLLQSLQAKHAQSCRTLKTHIESNLHADKVAALQQQVVDDSFLKESIEKFYSENPNASMASLTTDVHVYRVKVVKAFLMSGTLLERIEVFASSWSLQRNL